MQSQEAMEVFRHYDDMLNLLGMWVNIFINMIYYYYICGSVVLSLPCTALPDFSVEMCSNCFPSSIPVWYL